MTDMQPTVKEDATQSRTMGTSQRRWRWPPALPPPPPPPPPRRAEAVVAPQRPPATEQTAGPLEQGRKGAMEKNALGLGDGWRPSKQP